MPPNEEEAPYEISPPYHELPFVNLIPSPIDYESLSTSFSDISFEDIVLLQLYETLQIPHEPTLKELVQSATGCENIDDVTSVKLRVIARDVSLQHLSFLTPLLRELILDGSVVSSLRDLGCGLNSLKVLRVNRCDLNGLDGTFGLQTLEELYAGKNKIKDISPCSHLPNIKVIDVRSNLIQDIAVLTFLTLCPDLEHIILDSNEAIVNYPKYRQTVKSFLPGLKLLDELPFTEEECSLSVTNSEDEEPKIETDCLDDAPQECSTKDTFLPPIVRPSTSRLDNNKNSGYMVTFPPKILSPQSSSATESSRNGIHVNRAMLPEIVSPSGGSASSVSSNVSNTSRKK